MSVKLPSLRRRRKPTHARPSRQRTGAERSRDEQTARRKAIAEASGAVLFTVGCGVVGAVIAGALLGLGVAFIIGGAALVAVGNV